jgi:hypothetical protein
MSEFVGEHLFRREAGRLVAALTRLFGVHNLALAEDVSDLSRQVCASGTHATGFGEEVGAGRAPPGGAQQGPRTTRPSRA